MVVVLREGSCHSKDEEVFWKNNRVSRDVRGGLFLQPFLTLVLLCWVTLAVFVARGGGVGWGGF